MISKAERMSHQTGDQWARKHDGYAVFTPDGFPMEGSNSVMEIRAIANASDLTDLPWRRLKRDGFTVRRVTITEVKDDE